MKEFLELLAEDEDLRERFLAQDSMEDAYSVAKLHLKNVSFEEFQKGLTSVAKNMSLKEGSIPEDELSSVSGGAITWKGFKDKVMDYAADGIKAGAKAFFTKDGKNILANPFKLR